jgi:DNA-binding MarR family transcriptional regulator
MRTDRPHTTTVAEGGPALFRLVRFWSRRWAAGSAQHGDAHVAHILVLEAVEAASAGGSGTRSGSAAIGDVASELGVDRSNASRMLADAVAAGFVTKTASPDDARRTVLGITPAGRSLLDAARAWQEDMFSRLVADWPRQDARRFAGYLHRLAAEQSRPSDQREQGDHP